MNKNVVFPIIIEKFSNESPFILISTNIIHFEILLSFIINQTITTCHDSFGENWRKCWFWWFCHFDFLQTFPFGIAFTFYSTGFADFYPDFLLKMSSIVALF